MQQNSENNSRIDWAILIAEQKKSGLTQKEFCNQRGLILSQFVYHRCSKNKSKMIKPTGSVLKPVKIISKEHSIASGDICLSLPNGFQCTFPCSFDVIQIRRLIEVLLSC